MSSGWANWIRLAVAVEGGLVLGETLYIFWLVRDRMLRAPGRHVVAVAVAHNIAIGYMIAVVVSRFNKAWHLWPTGFAACVFALTHYALIVLVKELRGRKPPAPILVESPAKVEADAG